jgi:hypothetical protein
MYNEGTLELKPGCDKDQTLESNINGILSKIRDEVGDLCRQKMPIDNPPLSKQYMTLIENILIFFYNSYVPVRV